MSEAQSESFFGGNRVVSLNGGQPTVRLANGRYIYRMVSLGPAESHIVDDMGSFSVLCLSVGRGAGVTIGGQVDDVDKVLRAGDVARVERRTVVLTAGAGPGVLLVAGVREQVRDQPSIEMTRAADHYRVSKPWGHELWFNGEHPAYVLKEVFIRGGNRTSLQYHHFKEETNLLVSGTAALVYKADPAVANDDAREPDLASTTIQSPSFVHIVPGVLHRLIAESDVLLYEASTPHLDDVVRVQDDSGRQHGRIATEHRG
jgi:mannose-6-phosphate isomerase-like protein (cupin superfamily)